MVPFVTFFTVTRPFVGEFDRIQRLAISSWLSAVPTSEVLVFGNREGTADACRVLGAKHIPAVTTNEHGTELVNAVFKQAHELAQGDWRRWLCEVSADIVLGGDFAMALEGAEKLAKPFIVGQRWDVKADNTMSLHPPCGIDYFLYRRDTLGEIPPFAVGRSAYDQWLLWAAIEQWGMTVIDATETITALHQNHGYPEYGDKAKLLASEERAHNLELASECKRWYGINDAPFVMKMGKVVQRYDEYIDSHCR
jgi:hypothetical protein